MLKQSPEKPVRNRIDLSTKELARHWCRHFGVSQEELIGGGEGRRQRRNCYKRTRQVKHTSRKLSSTAPLLQLGEVVLKYFLAPLKRF